MNGTTLKGAIAYGNRLPLVFVRDNMMSLRYVDNVFEPYLFHYIRRGDPTHFLMNYYFLIG